MMPTHQFKPILFFIAGLFIMTGYAVQADTPKTDRVLNIEAVQTPKGLTIWHVEDHSLPIQTVHFAFRGAGSVNDPQGKDGLAQLLSNSMDEGAGTRDANAFQEALNDHAIDLNFNSSRDYFSGKMKTLKRHHALAVELLRDALHSPRFDVADVERMKQANLMRIKNASSQPDWLASRLMNATYFDGHPYAKNSGGTLSGLLHLTPDDLKQYVTTYLTRDRLVIATAGDMNADEAGQMVDEIFADLPTSSTGDIAKMDMVKPSDTFVKKAYKTQSPQSVVQMIWPSLSKTDPDYYALRVMNHILGGGGFSSMLMDEIREKKGLTYGIYSLPTFLEYSDYLLVESSTSPENINPMVVAIEQVLQSLKTKVVDEKTLKEAKDYLIGSLPLRFSSTLSLSGAALRMQLDGRSQTSLDEWRDNIGAVTADDVMRVANRLFKTEDPTAMVVVGAVPDDLDIDRLDSVPGIK